MLPYNSTLFLQVFFLQPNQREELVLQRLQRLLIQIQQLPVVPIAFYWMVHENSTLFLRLFRV